LPKNVLLGDAAVSLASHPTTW